MIENLEQRMIPRQVPAEKVLGVGVGGLSTEPEEVLGGVGL